MSLREQLSDLHRYVQALTRSIFASTGTSGGTWASSDPSVASVALSPSVGLFYAQKAGTTTISYTVAPGACGAGLRFVLYLTVNPAGNAGVITDPAHTTGPSPYA